MSWTEEIAADQILQGVDLSPRGSTVIDLLGMCTAANFREWGTCYSSWIPKEDLEREKSLGRNSSAESDRIARSVRSKKVAVEVLRRLGKEGSEHESLRMLQCSIDIAIMERWFPRRFINEQETKS